MALTLALWTSSGLIGCLRRETLRFTILGEVVTGGRADIAGGLQKDVGNDDGRRAQEGLGAGDGPGQSSLRRWSLRALTELIALDWNAQV